MLYCCCGVWVMGKQTACQRVRDLQVSTRKYVRGLLFRGVDVRVRVSHDMAAVGVAGVPGGG